MDWGSYSSSPFFTFLSSILMFYLSLGFPCWLISFVQSFTTKRHYPTRNLYLHPKRFQPIFSLFLTPNSLPTALLHCGLLQMSTFIHLNALAHHSLWSSPRRPNWYRSGIPPPFRWSGKQKDSWQAILFFCSLKAWVSYFCHHSPNLYAARLPSEAINFETPRLCDWIWEPSFRWLFWWRRPWTGTGGLIDLHDERNSVSQN